MWKGPGEFKQSYLLELCRYVVLNPVRARIVRSAADYPWSSYRATAGLRESPALLCTKWVLAQFGGERTGAQDRYRRFVEEGVGQPSPWERLKRQMLLGEEDFVETMQAWLTQTRTLFEVPRVQRYADRPALEALFDSEYPCLKRSRIA